MLTFEEDNDFLSIVKEYGLGFRKLSDYHYRSGEYDFWPTTGTVRHRESGRIYTGPCKLLGFTIGFFGDVNTQREDEKCTINKS